MTREQLEAAGRVIGEETVRLDLDWSKWNEEHRGDSAETSPAAPPIDATPGPAAKTSSPWTPGGVKASPAAARKVLEKAGLDVSHDVAPSYTHTGQMYGGGGFSSKGIRIAKATIDTRLSYSFGRSSTVPDYERTRAAQQMEQARSLLHAAGFETRELPYLRGTYEVQKPPKKAK